MVLKINKLIKDKTVTPHWAIFQNLLMNPFTFEDISKGGVSDSKINIAKVTHILTPPTLFQKPVSPL